jgi:hypothetical protein
MKMTFQNNFVFLGVVCVKKRMRTKEVLIIK